MVITWIFPTVGPEFINSALQQTPTLLEPFSLSCTVIGFPSPNSTTWFHNGTVVESNSDVIIMTETVDIYTTRSTLMITSAQAGHSGSYYCVAASPRQLYANVTSEMAQVFVLSKFTHIVCRRFSGMHCNVSGGVWIDVVIASIPHLEAC